MFTVEVEHGNEPVIYGGPFRDAEYVFEQLHFHWGWYDSILIILSVPYIWINNFR